MLERGKAKVALSNIKPLDGLRALAILLVLFWHYINCEITSDIGIKKLTFWTWSGVDLFFVLSGFLIGRILIFNKESKNYFKTFYARRIFRIFPPYYFVLIAFLVFLSFPFSANFPWLTMDQMPAYSYFLYIQNFWMAHSSTGPNWLGVTWSLAIEEQFYIILPIVVFLVNRKNLPLILILGIIAAPIFRANLSGLGPYLLLPARMDSLLLGVLIAHYHLKGTLEKTFKKKQGTLLLVLAACFALVFMFGAGKPMAGIGGTYLHTALALLYSTLLILVLVAEPGSSLTKFMSNPTLGFISRISYMVYLTHQLISGLLFETILGRHTPQLNNINGFLVTALALVVTIGFSTASYYFFEKPLLNLGKKYTY